MDQNLLSLVQQDVKDVAEKIKKTEAEQTAIQKSLGQLRAEQAEIQDTVSSIQDQQSSTRVQLEEHDKQLEALLEWKEQQVREHKEILEKLVAVEKTLSEELLIRVQGIETGLAETGDRVEQLEHGYARVEKDVSETSYKVKQLEHEVRSQRMKGSKQG